MRGVGPKEMSSYFKKLRPERASLGVQECVSSVRRTIAIGWNWTRRPLEGGDFHSKGGQSTGAHVPWALWSSLSPGIVLWKLLRSSVPAPITAVTWSHGRKGSKEGLILAIFTVKPVHNVLMNVWMWMCLYICKYTSMQICVSIYLSLCVHLPKWCQ